MNEANRRNPRRSLTRAQLEDPDALELLALLQGVTADGRLRDEEIEALAEWLKTNADSPLPAIELLRTAVEAALADGEVSPEERSWLQKTIETVLPREEREFAAVRRREAIASDRQAAKAAQERDRERARLSKPVARLDFMVAGTRYEGRSEVIRYHCRVGDQVQLVREIGNPYSPNATLVRLGNGRDIGYVPETHAVGLAALIDGGARHSVEIKKILEGRAAPIPVVWGELYLQEAGLGEAIPAEAYHREATTPTRREAATPTGRAGCALAATVLVGLTLLAIF